jgi:hypothetical protein
MIIDNLEWDDMNLLHLNKRNVSPNDIEDICYGKHLASRGRNKRYNLYGQTKSGRFL